MLWVSLKGDSVYGTLKDVEDSAPMSRSRPTASPMRGGPAVSPLRSARSVSGQRSARSTSREPRPDYNEWEAHGLGRFASMTKSTVVRLAEREVTRAKEYPRSVSREPRVVRPENLGQGPGWCLSAAPQRRLPLAEVDDFTPFYDIQDPWKPVEKGARGRTAPWAKDTTIRTDALQWGGQGQKLAQRNGAIVGKTDAHHPRVRVSRSPTGERLPVSPRRVASTPVPRPIPVSGPGGRASRGLETAELINEWGCIKQDLANPTPEFHLAHKPWPCTGGHSFGTSVRPSCKKLDDVMKPNVTYGGRAKCYAAAHESAISRRASRSVSRASSRSASPMGGRTPARGARGRAPPALSLGGQLGARLRDLTSEGSAF